MPTLRKVALHKVTAAIFRATGAPDDIAAQVADVLVDNHLAGHDSHGILRIPEYVQSVRAGEIVPTARPYVLEESPTSALVSGNWAFGQVTGIFAADLATEKAKRERVAVLSVVQAGHTGRLAAFTERAARRGVAMFMAIGTVNRPITAPYGGSAPVLGTNPVSFSIPNPAGSSHHARLRHLRHRQQGKSRLAKAKHEQLPPNAILDSQGRPSTDPHAFFDGGFLLPFGGHKGYALAVIAELLERSPGRRRRVSGRDQPQRDLHFYGGCDRLSTARRTTRGHWPKRSAGSRPCRRPGFRGSAAAGRTRSPCPRSTGERRHTDTGRYLACGLRRGRGARGECRGGGAGMKTILRPGKGDTHGEKEI